MENPTTNSGLRPQILPIWPGDAPGSVDWNYAEKEWYNPAPDHLRFIRNVTRPTLTAFFPDPARANGTAVIVCPGGGHHFLNIDEEGLDVARWLSGRGIAAFVLKYRLVRTPESDEAFTELVGKMVTEVGTLIDAMRAHGPLAIADGQQAVRVVRSRARQWGLSPDRIGIMGFSAGGHVAGGVALQHDADSRPNFAAPIYGALWDDIVVPPDAPPLFIAVANNDSVAVDPCLRLYTAWKDARIPAELHVYSTGGHGFSTRTQGLPVDSWIERFGDWLRVQGLLERAA